MRVAHPVAVELEQIYAVAFEKISQPIHRTLHRFEKERGGAKVLHAEQQLFFRLQPLVECVLFLTVFRHVEGHFDPLPRSVVPAEQLILQHIRLFCDGITLFPSVKASLFQLRIGAEFARGVPALQNLIALFSLQLFLRNPEVLFSFSIQIEHIVGFRIRHINELGNIFQ